MIVLWFYHFLRRWALNDKWHIKFSLHFSTSPEKLMKINFQMSNRRRRGRRCWWWWTKSTRIYKSQRKRSWVYICLRVVCRCVPPAAYFILHIGHKHQSWARCALLGEIFLRERTSVCAEKVLRINEDRMAHSLSRILDHQQPRPTTTFNVR